MSSTTTECSAKGAAVCDAAYPNLPTADEMKLMGVSGECLYTFTTASKGLVFLDGVSNDAAKVTNDIDLDIPALVTLLGGGPNEDVPPTFDHIMVLDGTEWRKWRGPTGLTGYLFWNGSKWAYGQINETGVCTRAVLAPVTAGFMAVWDTAITPSSDDTQDKCLKYVLPTVPDLFYVAPDGQIQQVNPTNKKGLVMFQQNGACDATIFPQVLNLCEVTNPPCMDKPLAHNIIGCDIDGGTASTADVPTLPEHACGFALVNPGAAGEWVNAPIGRTFYPGNSGTLLSGAGSSGSDSGTFTALNIQSATGYTLPTGVTHVTLWVKAKLMNPTASLSTLSITLAGIGAADISAYSFDGVVTDQTTHISEITAPVGASGEVTYNLASNSIAGSTYDFTINVAGLIACVDTTPTA